MNNQIDYIIARVLSGETYDDDYRLLNDWLKQSEENRVEFERIKTYWEPNMKSDHTLYLKATYAEQQILIVKKELKRKRLQLWYACTSVAVILVLFSVTVFYSFKPSQHENTVEIKEYFTYLTNDSRSNLTLDDGTQVALNRNSRLTYSNDFGKDVRRVVLEGEAFFNVTHNIDLPFEVSIKTDTDNDLFVKVYGTSFNVKTNNTRKTVVTLVEGSVSFFENNKEVKMWPDQQLEFDNESGRMKLYDVESSNIIAWKDGLMKYSSVSLASMMEELSMHYNKEIVINSRKWREQSATVSGTFEETESLDNILNVVSRSLPIKWKKKNGVFYIE